MDKFHKHQPDCPFSFAPLDVCDCVERNLRARIEADAKRIAELALTALAAETQADEAYQARLAAEARVKVLEEALRLIELIGYREGESFGWIAAHVRGVATAVLSRQSIEHYWRFFPKHRNASATLKGEK